MCTCTTLDKKKEPSSRFAARRTLFHVWYHAQSHAISAEQKSRTVADLTMPCADRWWSSMISHVEQHSSRRQSRGWFFFFFFVQGSNYLYSKMIITCCDSIYFKKSTILQERGCFVVLVQLIFSYTAPVWFPASRHSNFDTVPNALSVMIRVITGEDWNRLMVDATVCCSSVYSECYDYWIDVIIYTVGLAPESWQRKVKRRKPEWNLPQSKRSMLNTPSPPCTHTQEKKSCVPFVHAFFFS